MLYPPHAVFDIQMTTLFIYSGLNCITLHFFIDLPSVLTFNPEQPQYTHFPPHFGQISKTHPT